MIYSALFNSEPYVQREEVTMKKGIHPEMKRITVRCVCGAEFESMSTLDDIRVEICSQCHPYFTGKQKLVDTAGMVEKYRRRYGLNTTEQS